VDVFIRELDNPGREYFRCGGKTAVRQVSIPMYCFLYACFLFSS